MRPGRRPPHQVVELGDDLPVDIPKRQCAAPEIAVVPTSARCTEAEAIAGLMPLATRSVDEVTPYAMPNEPSTICAASPMRANTITDSTRTSQ